MALRTVQAPAAPGWNPSPQQSNQIIPASSPIRLKGKECRYRLRPVTSSPGTHFAGICLLTGGRPMYVLHDADVFDGDETLAHHLVQYGQQALDPLGMVDDVHDDRQVLGEAEDARRVNPGMGAVTLDASQHRRAGQTFLAAALHDGR